MIPFLSIEINLIIFKDSQKPDVILKNNECVL